MNPAYVVYGWSQRDWYKDKNLYDSTGRRIYFRVDGSKVYKNNSLYSDDPDQIRDMVEQKELDPRKKTVVLMVESMSTAMSLMPMGNFKKFFIYSRFTKT